MTTNAAKLLNRAHFTVAAAEPRQWPREASAEVAFAGRSNVGKSSAINTITGRRGLARTSKTPGRTQQIVFFDLGGGAALVDLPGYGYAKVPDRVRAAWAVLIERYLTEREALRGLVLLMDARHPLTELDQNLLAWCEPGGLPVHILLTKTDKLSRGRAKQSELQVAEAVSDLRNEVTVQQFSSLKRTGVEQAQTKIAAWLWDAGVEPDS
ncbi:MAG TPA: ribosome biogenesis GTP-binding protein YihA/YsxC [Arenicellales bacterium]|nr:ribosome biogenesis GTP-binding protein YihA/YsxC [Arenicellales bacterium]